jgi:hypothetical protein
LRSAAARVAQTLRAAAGKRWKSGGFRRWHVPCKTDGNAESRTRASAFWINKTNQTGVPMKLSRILTVTSLIAVLALSAATLSAQDNTGDRQNRRNRDGQQGGPGGPGGNFDPAEMQRRMLERTQEQLEVTDANEWKALEPLVQKVMDARMAIGFGGRGFGRGGRDAGGPGRGGFGAPNPDADALQKAIDAKASNAEIKTALAKYQESRKAKQAALEKAQADLRKVLTPRQEAIAALNGLL